MASRANKEERPRSFGPPMSTPAPDTDREKARKRKLETKASDAERKKLIEEHRERGQEETAKRRRDRKTEAPKPKPDYETVRQPGGGTPAQILQERPADVEKAIQRAEGVKVEEKEE